MAELSLHHLTKAYEDQMLFSDFSLQFPQRGLCILEGESGRGKTTLLRLIAGLESPTEGSITGGGRTCAFHFQEYRLFPKLSVLENVTVSLSHGSKEEKKARATQMLASLGLGREELHKLPNELSGGMKQRVSLARTLLSDKPILLLDEPTKELDSVLRAKVIELLTALAKERLILMTTHQTEDLPQELALVFSIPWPTERR